MGESGSKTTKTGSRPAGRTKLDRRTIIEAGAEFIDQQGVRQLTMRRLGGILGVEAMALYRHVPSREVLLDGIADLALEDVHANPALHLQPQEGWQDYVLRLAHGLRRITVAHPRLFALVATRPPEAPWVRPPLRNLRCAESFLGALASSGFRQDAAVAAYRVFNSFLLGPLLLEASAREAGATPAGTQRAHPAAAADLHRYPQVLQAQDLLFEDRSAEEFAASLGTLLEQLEALAGSGSGWRTASG
jgi:AcrR family transcriptional regulator